MGQRLSRENVGPPAAVSPGETLLARLCSGSVFQQLLKGEDIRLASLFPGLLLLGVADITGDAENLSGVYLARVLDLVPIGLIQKGPQECVPVDIPARRDRPRQRRKAVPAFPEEIAADRVSPARAQSIYRSLAIGKCS